MGIIILHLDVNSYYATMEQQAYPSLRGKPIGVAGKGRGERTVMVGASIEAKKLGVRGIMSTWEAKKLCPKIIIVPANYDRYIFTSKRIFAILERFSPKVEIFSIDEAFIELPNRCSWEDAVLIAKQIKKLIHTQIGSWVTCSIGISYGRILAKLASELQKPDGLTVICPENFPEIAAITPIEELCGIGWALQPRLNQMGIFTIAELGNASLEMLIKTFGPHTGSWLHDIGNGRDDGRLRSFRELPQEKSVGHSYTLPQDISNPGDAKRTLLLLCERVAIRLRRKGLLGRGITLYLRFGDSSMDSESPRAKSRGDKTGFGQHLLTQTYSADGYQIYLVAERLLATAPLGKPIRLVAISVYELIKQVEHTKSLFLDEQHHEELLEALDKINNRYGEFTVHRAALSRVKKRIFKLPDGRNQRLYSPETEPDRAMLRRRSIATSPFMKRLN